MMNALYHWMNKTTFSRQFILVFIISYVMFEEDNRERWKN